MVARGRQRRWLALGTAASLAVMAVLHPACRKAENRGGGVQLTYWPSSNPHEISLARELVRDWNKAHPDTLVALQPLPEGRSGEEVLIIAAAGGTAPDICSNVSPIIVPLLARAGALVPVDSFPGGRDLLERRVSHALLKHFISPDGNLYQIPWKGNPILVQYNLGILKEVGVDSLPKTWSEWYRLAERASGDTNGDGRPDRWMADLNIIAEWRQRLFDFYPLYIAATGGHTLLTDNRYVAFDNDTTVSVFEFFNRGFRKGWYAKSVFIGDVFLQGHMAAHITGPWNIAHTERFKPKGFTYGFGPIPVPDDFTGPVYTFGDHKSIGIFSTTPHPEAAWNFVTYLVSRHADLRLLEVCNQLPLRHTLLADSLFDAYFERNPMMTQFARQVPLTRGFDQNPAMQEVFDAINEQFDAACIQGERPVAVAVDEAADRARHVLATRGI